MRPLVIDNFAGGGGASTGIERAIGREIDVAINHDPEAIAMHLANHPGTRHFCQSIMAIDPLDATGGRRVGLLWFSPDCKHHSKAKGGKPREKNIRDLAWVVVHWIERLQDAWARAGGEPADAIQAIMLENVEEFRQWGPLDDAGMPIKERRGEEFDLFVRRIKRRGARVEFRELRACDYGAPTSRKRLYMIARFDGRPIVWPTPSHGKPGSPEVLSGARLPWRTAAECIDWSIPCPSIFDRARELKPATHRRIAHGVMRYVVNAAKPFVVGTAFTSANGARHFDPQDPLRTATAQAEYGVVDAAIVPITHAGQPDRVHPADDPMRTVTGAHRGEFARATVTLAPHVTKFRGGAKHGLVVGHLEKFSENSRGRPADAPLDAVMAGAPRHAAVTAFLSHFYTSNTNGGQGDPTLPAKTVTSAGQHHAVVCAHMEQANTGRIGHPMPKPMSTITSQGSHQRLVETTLVDADALPPEVMARAVRVAAFLIKYYGNETDGHGLDAPIGTVTTLDRFAVVTVTIDAVTYVIVDIGMRMLTPRELARAQGFPDDYILDPVGPKGKPLPKSAQIRMIGNSVCPDVATALVRANLPDLCADAQPDEAAA